MTGFDVTVPAVAQAALTAESIGLDLRSELEALRVQAEGVFADAWSGRAAASFGRAWCDWHTEAAQVIAALSGLAEALQATVTSYLERDEAERTRLRLAAT